jgi:uncharacterized membrane protein HdeD (DUF308 family)
VNAEGLLAAGPRDIYSNLRPSLLFFRSSIGFIFAAALLSIAGPGMFLFTMLVGTYLFVDGLSLLFLQKHGRRRPYRSYAWSMLGGLVGVVAGVLAFLSPTTPTFALAVITGLWAMVIGSFHLDGAFQLARDREVGSGMQAFLSLSAFTTFLIGGLILFQPWLGLIPIGNLLAVNAVLIAISALFLRVELRRVGGRGDGAKKGPDASLAA